MSEVTLSTLMKDIECFIRFKRTLGRRYEATARLLCDFGRFAKQYAHSASRERIGLEPLVKAWLVRPGLRKPTTTAQQFGAIRELCLFRRRRSPHGYVPDRALAPRRGPKFLPYALSHEQVRAILEAARRHQGTTFWGPMLHLLLLIQYCTGLRPGEPLRLRMADVDMNAHTFLIRDSKGRTRIVPFGTDLGRVIHKYLKQRAALASHSSDHLLLDRHGKALKMYSVTNVIGKLWRRVGLKPARGPGGPRAYDLRHAFAVHRLTRWYAQRVDLHARLPWLSAYMGHENLLGTEAYLHATPSLLRTASRRFAKRLKCGISQQ